jgi:hypothetical protein
VSFLGLFGRKPEPNQRLEQLENELRALKRHLSDVEDVLSHRVNKLMARAKRAPVEEPASDGSEPVGVAAPPPPAGFPPLAAIKRRMRGF